MPCPCGMDIISDVEAMNGAVGVSHLRATGGSCFTENPTIYIFFFFIIYSCCIRIYIYIFNIIYIYIF